MRASRVLCTLTAGLLSASRDMPHATVSSFIVHRTTVSGRVDRTFVPGATALLSNSEFDLRLTVNGSLLDLSTGADVVNESGTVVTGSRVDILTRQGGANTHIDLDLSGLEGKPAGKYRIRIHYAIETNGPDIVNLRLLARGTVTSITRDASPALLANAYVPLGQTSTIRVSGTALDVATIDPVFLGKNFTIVSRTSTSMVLSVKFTQPGRYMLYQDNFYDENLGHVPTLSDQNEMGVSYQANAGLEMLAAAVPVVTTVSPQPAGPTGVIQLTGSGLASSGLYLNSIRYGHRYTGGTTALSFSPSVTATTFSRSPTSASLSAAYDIDGDALDLVLLPEDVVTTAGFPSPPSYTLSVPFVAHYPPELAEVIASAELPPIAGVRVLRAGVVSLVGKYLFVTNASSGTFTRGSLTAAPLILASPSTSPTVTLGTLTFPVAASIYVPPSGATPGRDTVRVTLSDPADNVSGQFQLQTAYGNTTVASQFVLATKPRVASVTDVTQSTVQAQALTSPTLLRGRQYLIAGNALSLKTSTQLLQTGTVRLNGRVMALETTTDPATQLRFIVPLDAATGALTVATVGGETTVGTYTVADAPAGSIPTPRPTLLTTAPSNVASGLDVTGTVTLDNPGASVAGFTVSLASSDTSVARVPPSVAASGTSVSFTIATKNVTSPRTVTITATSGGASQSRTFTVTPPVPTALTLSSIDVVAGATVTGTVSFTVSGSGAAVALSSSDAAAPVPVSVTMNTNGATFSIATTEAPAPRTVTITASANGVSKSATVTVTPLRITSVTTSLDTIRVGRNATITATVNRAPAANVPLTLASSAPSLVAFDQAELKVSGGQTSGTIVVRALVAPTAPTRVTITISRSVVTAGFGTVTTSAVRDVVVAP